MENKIQLTNEHLTWPRDSIAIGFSDSTSEKRAFSSTISNRKADFVNLICPNAALFLSSGTGVRGEALYLAITLRRAESKTMLSVTKQGSS